MRTTFNPLGMASDMKYPDYSNPITLTQSITNQTIIQDGWINWSMGWIYEQSLYINNTIVAYTFGQQNTFANYNSIIIPVKKGDTYRVSNVVPLDSKCWFSFFPNR